jgi:hypothetical protein
MICVWEQDLEFATLSDSAFDLDAAAVSLDDSPHDRKAETCPFHAIRTPAEEGVEDPR